MIIDGRGTAPFVFSGYRRAFWTVFDSYHCVMGYLRCIMDTLGSDNIDVAGTHDNITTFWCEMHGFTRHYYYLKKINKLVYKKLELV